MKKKLKNIKAGKNNFLVFFIILFFSTNISTWGSEESSNFLEGNFIEIKILDKVSSKNSLLKIKIGEEVKFKNLKIKPLRCKNSEFDDSPEIAAYLQVKDSTNKKKMKSLFLMVGLFIQALRLIHLTIQFMIFGLPVVIK
tara:strand:- start:119 stop:538 length:420 start_codon:yes stop_codon:yes gene_type:complete